MWNTTRFQLDPKLFAGIGELRVGIFIERWGVFLFVGKNSAPVCEKLIRDAILGKNLMEYMVVTIQGFLGIKLAPGNAACSIIYGKMQVPYLTGNPFIGGSIHLLEFTKISCPGTS